MGISILSFILTHPYQQGRFLALEVRKSWIFYNQITGQTASNRIGSPCPWSLQSYLEGKYRKKVKFLVWELSHSRLNTLDKLQRRCSWWSISPWCKTESESRAHIFMECPYSSLIWKQFLSILAVVPPNNLWDWLALTPLHHPFKQEKATLHCFPNGLGAT